jgi:hypothetical protein
MLLDPVLPLAPMPLVAPLPGVAAEAAGSLAAPDGLLEPVAADGLLEPVAADGLLEPVAADGLLDPTAPVSPGVPAGPLEPMLPVPAAGGVLALLPAAPMPLTAGEPAMPLDDPVPDAPGVVVEVDVFGVLFADLSSPQPVSARASATPAAIVNCLVMLKSSQCEWFKWVWLSHTHCDTRNVRTDRLLVPAA